MLDETSQDPAPPLSLHGPLLRERLAELRGVEPIAALRQQIGALKAELADPASALRAGEGDAGAVALGRAYLAAELDQIAAALTGERARYYIERLIRAIGEERTRPINDINLNRWKEYDEIHTDSLWIIDRRDSSGVHTAGYWGNFVPQIPYQMMRRYTRRGDWVLDPFAGLGTTLIEGQRLGRNVLGVELQAAVADRARALVRAEPNPHGVIAELVEGDSTTCDLPALLAGYGREAVQLAILHPPYFDIIRFSDDPRDLSNAPSVAAFLAQIGQVVERVVAVLERGRYLVLVIGDKYLRGEWVPLGFQTMEAAQRHGLLLKSIVVKNFEQTAGKRAQAELWKYRALAGGFYIFKHEYIFVFQKR